VTAWTAESLPPELAALHDAPGGTSLRRLAEILNAYDRLRDEPDPAAVYGGDLTPPLCCCKRGMECAECFTGHHWQCPDRDDTDDKPDTAGGWFCNNSNCNCREEHGDD
jgi:hypothetical protein